VCSLEVNAWDGHSTTVITESNDGACHNWRVFPRSRIAIGVSGAASSLVGLCVGTLLPPTHYNIWWNALCSLGGALAILFGFMVLVRAGVPNVPRGRVRVAVIALLAAYLGWYCWASLVLAVRKSGDLGHCQDFVDAAVQTRLVPQSVSAPGRPAVFCTVMEYGVLRSDFQVVEVYGVPMDQQRKVQTAITIARHRVHGPSVQVVFYEGENWQTWTSKDGSVSGGSRGPEKIQRIVVVR